MNQTSLTFLDTCRKETRWVTHPGGVLGISSDGDDQMQPKVKTQKNP